MSMQRDICIEMKTETVLNVRVLSKLKGMPQDIFRQVVEENALEKPTQNILNNLTYYFASIIDPKASESFPWPIYDSTTEKKFRDELSRFISNHSSKGILTPVMTSYLVKPNSYKVTLLIFQMSQLAIQKHLEYKIKKECQRKLCNEITVNYRSWENNFIQQTENQTKFVLSKFSNYLQKRKNTEMIAAKMRTKISEMESKLASINAEKFLNDLIVGFISKHELDIAKKEEILQIRSIAKTAPFFDRWLIEVDRKIEEMESKWSEKMTPFIQLCQESKQCTELLVARHTGEAERDSYMIEYNHKTDEICTEELQDQVNIQQKYVLKNIVKDEKLSFPNLIQGFLIAIGFILKGAETGDEIYQFNEYLEEGKRSYGELVQALRDLLRRVREAECQLEPSQTEMSANHFSEISLLPDLSDLPCAREMMCPALFDTFTPISMSKHQFNLWHKSSLKTFVRPQPMSLLTPFQAPKIDFKNRISYHPKSDLNTTQNFHNMSIISKTDRANETIAGYSTGCTKQQLFRLLSTKKSSSKKTKHGEPSMKIKRARLFNESNSSNESNRLVRSYSSPNLSDNKEARSGRRKLSVMHESSPMLEVSGIVALDKENSCESRNQSSKSQFTIKLTTATPPSDTKFHQDLKDFNVDLDKEFLLEKLPNLDTMVTPKNNPQPTSKTTSLEKIINRFKKIRETMHQEHGDSEKSNDFQIITEEKENIFTANKILLPDLIDTLSPSCSNSFDDLEVVRKPRESLGTVLGVDHTFLDQIDLID